MIYFDKERTVDFTLGRVGSRQINRNLEMPQHDQIFTRTVDYSTWNAKGRGRDVRPRMVSGEKEETAHHALITTAIASHDLDDANYTRHYRTPPRAVGPWCRAALAQTAHN